MRGLLHSVTSAFALHFFPKPEAAIEEMRRITATNGLVSACVWDYAGRMEFLRRFCCRPDARKPHGKIDLVAQAWVVRGVAR